jgi:hypothetical protein
MINELFVPSKWIATNVPTSTRAINPRSARFPARAAGRSPRFSRRTASHFSAARIFRPTMPWGRPGFKRILLAVSEAFKTRRAEVDKSAQTLEEAVAKAEIFQGARGDSTPAWSTDRGIGV